MVIEFFYLVLISVEDLVLEVINEVGLVGYFFGIEYIQVCYCDVFYLLILSDWCNFEIW